MLNIDVQRLENITYQAILGHLEELEHKGAYQGNGHHLAQRLAQMVSTAVQEHEDRMAGAKVDSAREWRTAADH